MRLTRNIRWCMRRTTTTTFSIWKLNTHENGSSWFELSNHSHTFILSPSQNSIFNIYMIDFIIVLQVPRIHQSTVIVNWTFLNLMICLIWFFFFVEKRIDDLKSKYIHIPNRIQKQEKQNRLLYWQSMKDVQGKYSSEQTTKKPII